MTALWLLAIVTGAATMLGLRSWRHRIDLAELGSVSEQWLAEHRANDRQVSR